MWISRQVTTDLQVHVKELQWIDVNTVRMKVVKGEKEGRLPRKEGQRQNLGLLQLRVFGGVSQEG